MSDIVSTFRSYALDKDNCPRMDTEVVYVRVGLLLEAADRIEQLGAFARRVADLFEGKALGAEARAVLGEERT